jgi:hypothetical protein
MKKQTFFNVQYNNGGYANGTPLRLEEAEKLAEKCRKNGWEAKIVPTHDALWEEVYGDN